LKPRWAPSLHTKKGYIIEKIVLLYATVDNHTKKISEHIQKRVQEKGGTIEVHPIDSVDTLDLDSFDKIVIGSSIRYGKHHKNIYDFIEKNKQLLDSKPNAFFSVNVVARKPEKNQPDTNPYLIKFLKKISWEPKNLAVFAGMLDYQKYGLFDRQMIRFIMWMTKGPTDPKTVIEYTNWEAVDRFADTIKEM
jgi:menaquinone-dependent protoporphyrinogen oxidase